MQKLTDTCFITEDHEFAVVEVKPVDEDGVDIPNAKLVWIVMNKSGQRVLGPTTFLECLVYARHYEKEKINESNQ
jgi:hypothetical protein